MFAVNKTSGIDAKTNTIYRRAAGSGFREIQFCRYLAADDIGNRGRAKQGSKRALMKIFLQDKYEIFLLNNAIGSSGRLAKDYTYR